MSKQRKLFLFICFIIIDLLLVSGILLLRDVTLKNILSNEVNALVDLNFFKDDYSYSIKSRGNYAVIEEVIKDYLSNYATLVQKVANASNGVELSGLLLTSSIESDGPLFEQTLKYLDEYQVEFNQDMDEVFYYLDDNLSIDNYITQYTDNQEVIELYQELITKNHFSEKLENSKQQLVIERIDTNSYIDSVRAVIMFLKDNSNNYTISNGQVTFNDSNLLNEYVKLKDKTKRIY